MSPGWEGTEAASPGVPTVASVTEGVMVATGIGFTVMLVDWVMVPPAPVTVRV